MLLSNTLLCLVSACALATAAPQTFTPPSHQHNCPYPKSRAGLSRVYFRFWYDSLNLVGTNGGYEEYGRDLFFDDLTVTDNTVNYPKQKKRKKYPAPGKYARSRDQFGKIHAQVIPKAVEIFGIPQAIDTQCTYIASDCLTITHDCYYNATLKKAWGGKPAGTTFTYRDTRFTKVLNTTNNDDGQDYKLKSSVIKMDWTNFYKA